MSKRRKSNKIQIQPISDKRQAFNQAVNSVMAMDAFQNLLARTGFGSTNLMEGTQYLLTRMTRDYATLNALYRSNWLARRIVDIIPKDMMRNWVSYQSDVAPEQIDKLKKMERLTRLRASLLKGLYWGRLYGGAAGLIMLEGQEDALEEPLDLDDIMPGDFKGLLLVDRWQGIFPQSEMVTDLGSPEFGMPKYYEFRDPNMPNNPVAKVHHSRLIRFCGDDLPNWEVQAETYWGASVIESVYDELRKRDNTSANIAGLVFLANLRILKMNDLGQQLGLGTEQANKDFYNTLTAQNHLLSNFGMYVMDKEDDFQSVNYTFAGINDIYESFMLDMSGATQIPATKLFGRAPAGMNSTGENDMRNYYDVVEQEQEAHLRPALEKLLPILCMSTLGTVPDDIDFIFNPVGTPSDEQLANIVKAESEVVFAAHDRGLIADRTALQELKTMGEQSGLFSNITDDDINAANDKPVDPKMFEEDPLNDPKEAEENEGG